MNIVYSVLIPCLNEKENVPRLVSLMPQRDDIELIFIDGGSRDGTLEEIQEVLTAKHPFDVKLVIQRSKGMAKAIEEGSGVARGQYLIIYPADMTVYPGKLQPLFSLAEAEGSSTDFIIISLRLGNLQKGSLTFINYLGNRFFAFAASAALGQKITDVFGSPKLFHKDFYESFLRSPFNSPHDRFGDLGFLFWASANNYRIIRLPVKYWRRSYGKSKLHPFQDGLRFFILIFAHWLKLKNLKRNA